MKIKRKSGLTLIEIIVSLAILGIIAVSFLSMFSSGAISIFRGGNRSRNVYKLQQAAEKIFNTDTIAAYAVGNPSATSTTDNLLISFPSVTDLSILGGKVIINYTDTNVPVNVTIFLPD